MKIEHFGGTAFVDNASELERVLEVRYGPNANEFFLSDTERYPLLGILVIGDIAAIHYFPAEGHPGFLSVGDESNVGTVVFRTNTPDEELELAAACAIPIAQASQCAKEFLTASSLPSCIKWLEL